MTDEADWTLDQLVQRVSAALASPAYPGAPNGRVRDLPDRRAIRWYTTIGLVDRPAMQGRNARYGPRQLAQIVAVKRLQAQGRSLAEIQGDLVGAPDDTLQRVAALGDFDGRNDAQHSLTRRHRGRFWAERPVTPEPEPVADSVTTLAAVRLAGGALLLVPARPGDDDVSAIRAAAQPLLDLLADRGLLNPEEGNAT